MSEVFEIKGVELFATGEHNGATYTERDLDDMIEAFGKAGFRVPLKKGHTDDTGAPALGWLANLRKAGGKLIGDLTELPKAIYDAIRKRRYGQISLEVWTNLKNAAGSFRRVVKAVCLLGAEIPAVPGLKPAWENLSAFSFDEVRVFNITWRWTGMERMLDPHEAGVEVDRRAQRFTIERNLSYSDALRFVLREDADLARIYTGVPQEPQAHIVGEEVDHLTISRMHQTGEDYSTAFHTILKMNPDAATRYVAGK